MVVLLPVIKITFGLFKGMKIGEELLEGDHRSRTKHTHTQGIASQGEINQIVVDDDGKSTLFKQWKHRKAGFFERMSIHHPHNLKLETLASSQEHIFLMLLITIDVPINADINKGPFVEILHDSLQAFQNTDRKDDGETEIAPFAFFGHLHVILTFGTSNSKRINLGEANRYQYMLWKSHTVRRVFNKATSREPRQMEPKEVVQLRFNASRVVLSLLWSNHHAATVPAMVVCTTFLKIYHTTP